MAAKTTVLFSPIRSGSTLVYNAIRLMRGQCVKAHDYRKHGSDTPYVVIVRHPYNAIISSCLRCREEPTDETLAKHTQEYCDHGGRDLAFAELSIPRHCILKYEDIVDDHVLLLNTLSAYFEQPLSSLELQSHREFLCLDNMKRMASSLSSFDEHDPVTHIHGDHISKYNGKTDYTKLLSRSQIDTLDNNPVLTKIINRWYRKNEIWESERTGQMGD